jgi:hypothetical protein
LKTPQADPLETNFHMTECRIGCQPLICALYELAQAASARPLDVNERSRDFPDMCSLFETLSCHAPEGMLKVCTVILPATPISQQDCTFNAPEPRVPHPTVESTLCISLTRYLYTYCGREHTECLSNPFASTLLVMSASTPSSGPS